MSTQIRRTLRLALATAAAATFPVAAGAACNAWAYPCADGAGQPRSALTGQAVRLQAQSARAGPQANEGDALAAQPVARATRTRLDVAEELRTAQRARAHSGYRGHAEPLDAVYVN